MGTARAVIVDNEGTLRWKDDNKELALFGANYCLPSACDYRAPGYIHADRKKMVDEDMQHFARMGWDALRLSFWGDFENTDTVGNLINNDHLDVMDYVIEKAGERGIYILLSPIVTYSSLWPDDQQDTSSIHGISTYFKKNELGTNPRAIAAQANYLKQLLNHVNPYTHTAIKNEPSIIFIEMINEPAHHSRDLQGSVDYINALVDAVRSTGCNKVLFHNYSQDFNMAKAMQQSKIQGVTFAWYPSGLNSGATLGGNFLPVVDHYSKEMVRPEISRLARIVYEFDSPDLLTGYMYPAMARSFREVGAQWASMFSYDMMATAPYNLGWQTHCLNMVYTPTKAISAIIAAQVMKEIPRYKNFGNYPINTNFGAFNLDYNSNLGEMITPDKFIYTNTTATKPINAATLQKIVGYGSSPVVHYNGKGIYFLDKIKDGTWRLEVYPDAVQINDPFNMPSPQKLVFRSIHRNWPMVVNLPDLGSNFFVRPLDADNNYQAQSQSAKFNIQPGVYILTVDNHFTKSSLPKKIGFVGMNEFNAPKDQKLPVQLVLQAKQDEYMEGKPIIVKADVYDKTSPTSVTLFVKQKGTNWFVPVPMKNDSGYAYAAEVPTKRITDGWIDYCIVVKTADSIYNFPSGIHVSPGDWDYYKSETWHAKIVKQDAPLALLNPAADVDKLAFTRIGDGGRMGIFKMLPASDNGNAAFRLTLPIGYEKRLDDYTVSVAIKDKLADRKVGLPDTASLLLHARGISQKEEAYITLVENDGTSWSKKINLSPEWKDIKITLGEMEISKGVMLPLGYPGQWDYWFTPADGRGKPNDRIRLQNVERLQLSIRPAIAPPTKPNEDSWIEISSVILKI